MSDANTQEPTMEEILASIRRIISEDETPAAESAGAQAEAPTPVAAGEAPPAPKAEGPKIKALKSEPAKGEPPKMQPETSPKADVLELTQRVEPPKPPPSGLPPSGDIDFSDAPAPAAAAARPPSAPPPMVKSLVSDGAASTAASHFGQLAQTVAPPPSRTVDDIATELLRPMLMDWLNANLSQIVEASVAAEVERISRRGY